MGRQGLCTSDKIDTFTSKYPREFEKRKLLGEFVLYCKLCKTKVSCEKKTRVEIHRSGHVHQREIGQLQLTPVVNFIIPNTTTKFVSAFLRANIPLHKLRHPALKELFTELRVDYPSESAARRAVQPIHEKNLDTTRSLIKDKDVTIICDESPIDGTKYAHVAVAEVGEIPYLVACKEIEKANSTTMTHLIDGVVREMGIKRENFLHLMSDAAPYMLKTDENLKLIYPNLRHTTCLAHLLHNVSEQVRATFEDINFLIASVKAAVVNNRSRRNEFVDAGLGVPPQPSIIR